MCEAKVPLRMIESAACFFFFLLYWFLPFPERQHDGKKRWRPFPPALCALRLGTTQKGTHRDNGGEGWDGRRRALIGFLDVRDMDMCTRAPPIRAPTILADKDLLRVEGVKDWVCTSMGTEPRCCALRRAEEGGLQRGGDGWFGRSCRTIRGTTRPNSGHAGIW